MRSFFFGLKLALIFALILGSALAGILVVFLDVAGHELMDVLIRLNAYDGVETAKSIETRLASLEPDSEWYEQGWVEDLLRSERRRFGLWMKIEPGAAVSSSFVSSSPGSSDRHRDHHPPAVDVAGRQCTVTHLPYFRVHVPIFHRDAVIARLVVGHSDHAEAVHHAFQRGVGHIALIGLVAVIGLTVYLTLPLRRMRRSMDRIAAGDLEHRVAVRGNDEVTAVAQSFNAMADRIGSVLTGQKELLAGVSHEVRSPLARMTVLTELLRGKAPDDRVDDLEAEISAIDALVGELLLASRFDLGAEPVELEAHSLGALIEEAWSSVRAEMDLSGLRMLQDLDRDAAIVRADRALAVRILRNLFQNAARYAKRGTVTVTARRHGERIEVEVTDDGPGVRPEQIERLFEPFYRGDTARSHATNAVGLGLMIVRRAVEAHGGTVQARGVKPHGLAIRFDFSAG